MPANPITFAEYMQRCLYDPVHGYYTSGRQVFGPAGDFYTSAHTHRLFAEILADAFVELLRSLDTGGGPVQLVELGPGDRSLANNILSCLEQTHPAVAGRLQYVPIEVNGALPDTIRGLVFSNEFFDALPVHRVRVHNGRVHELYVQADAAGQIAETEGPLSDSRIARYMEIAFGRLREGWEYEVNLRMVECLEDLNRRIGQAWVFTIDYGFLREEYGEADRRAGTLLSYSRHRAVDDPYSHPGEQDLTAHVNFSVMIETGRMLGWLDHGLKSQREFMNEKGLAERLKRMEQSFRELNADRVEELLQLKRLLEPGGISDVMRVLVQEVRVR
ncbi:MAG: class I SAM-dependent methyltransferase [Acidobacteriota bacterium]